MSACEWGATFCFGTHHHATLSVARSWRSTLPSLPPGAHVIGGKATAPVLARRADEFYAPIIPVVAELDAAGLSLREIGEELKKRGIKPRYQASDEWSAAQVRRVLKRAKAAPRRAGKTGSPGPG